MELAESEILGGVERAPVFIESCAPNSSTPSLGQIKSVTDARTEEIDSEIGEKSNSAGECSKSDVG